MGRRYENPPIIEVLCEYRFEPSGPWDLTVPGLVYEKVQGAFPGKRLVKAVEASISTGPEAIRQEVLTTDRMQFLTQDEKALIQVGRDLLAINHLKPYPTWQHFLPLIRQGFDAYREVTNPKGIRRIGLRYINRVEIMAQPIELEEHFQFRPFVGSELPRDFGPFVVGIEIPYENSRDTLRLQLGSTPVATPNTLAAILDLDYSLARPGQVSLETVFEWVELAHRRVEEVFEACITERLRKTFEEVAE